MTELETLLMKKLDEQTAVMEQFPKQFDDLTESVKTLQNRCLRLETQQQSLITLLSELGNPLEMQNKKIEDLEISLKKLAQLLTKK